MKTVAQAGLHGVMAEFDDSDAVLEAARAAYAAGYRSMDAYSPLPVEGLAEAIGFEKNAVARIVFGAGLTGCLGGFFMQWFTSVVDYPLNIGGRPFNSWPAFLPITFETTVLCASLAAVFGMLALNGLPRPYHPVFNVESFDLASQSHFFLCIQADDPKFDPAEARAFLEGQDPLAVHDVEA